jgi:hypothetical protein
VFSLLVFASLAATPQKLAAPAWATVDVAPQKAEFFASRLASALHDRGLDVISSQDIVALLGVERQKQLLGCSDESSTCSMELANALGAELVLTGAIAKLETTYQVNLRVLRSLDGKVVAQTLVAGSSQEELVKALEGAAGSLATQLAPKGPSPSARSLAWLPFVAAGVFAVGAGLSLGLAFERSAALDTALVPGASLSVVNPIARAGATFEALAWTGAGLAAASAVTGVLMLVLGPSPVSVGVTPASGGATVSAGGVW